MGLHTDFPVDPYAILDPSVRWVPDTQEMFGDSDPTKLMPPLVHKIREGVKEWRNSRYAGASATSKALLDHWFDTPHWINTNGNTTQFRYYFAQREAVETAIWLYEIVGCKEQQHLLKFDSSDLLTTKALTNNWARYAFKMATGSGKTKVISLLIAWSYFHKLYEQNSTLSQNVLLIAPNIIVFERLKKDFEARVIFLDDPIIPENGEYGQNWKEDFQITVHCQDDVSRVSDTGNLFLTNIHRVYMPKEVPYEELTDTTDYFLGPKPVTSTTDRQTDLGEIIRKIPDLVVINDEAHHIHDEKLAWFKNIEDINNYLLQRGKRISVQFDFSATPKHENGSIFPFTVCDYPLVEAIKQQVVKTPVLPDQFSQSKLKEITSNKVTEKYQDYIRLGYAEWEKVYHELAPERKPILFIMTEDTKDCDEVGAYLELNYPLMRGKVLVIHTNSSGEILEGSKTKPDKKKSDELERLRKDSQDIDKSSSTYLAIVSVMVLREGWDVKNVTSIVGLRPYKSKSQILPEQTLGRGLRRMFRGENVTEEVSVIGTKAFIEFVERIKREGVELKYVEMGDKSRAHSPICIDIDLNKDQNELDIQIPQLTPKSYRDYKDLDMLEPEKFLKKKATIKNYSIDDQREIVFTDLIDEKVSHKIVMKDLELPDYHSVLGYFVENLARRFHYFSGQDKIFEKMKEFVEESLFEQPVNIADSNIIRNLASDNESYKLLMDAFISAINHLTIQTAPTVKMNKLTKLSSMKSFVQNNQDYYQPKKSLQTKIVCDSKFELEFASFVDKFIDVKTFFRNYFAVNFFLDYVDSYGDIKKYYPDFVVKMANDEIWIVETKGAEMIDTKPKFDRLVEWCKDAMVANPGVTYRALLVKYNEWERNKDRFNTFQDVIDMFGENVESEESDQNL